MSIPATSDDYERGFSTTRQVKTDWSSKLHIITLNDCMRISLEGPSIANFDPTDAMHNWYSAGIRKRRPDYAAVGMNAEVLEGIIEILDDEIVGDEMIQEEL